MFSLLRRAARRPELKRLLPARCKDLLKEHLVGRFGPRDLVQEVQPLPGVRFRLHVDVRSLLEREIYLHGVHEPEVAEAMARILRPGDLFIDAGAHRGYFSLLAAALVGPSGRVFAFEPAPVNRQALERNLTLQPDFPVTVCPVALDRASGKVWIHERRTGNTGATSLAPARGAHPEEVEALAFSDAVPRYSIDPSRVRLVKIDVEGAEVRVLEGMRELLGGPRPPDVVFEVNRQALARLGETPSRLIGRLQGWGYRVLSLRAGCSPAPLEEGSRFSRRACNLLATRLPARPPNSLPDHPV